MAGPPDDAPAENGEPEYQELLTGFSRLIDEFLEEHPVHTHALTASDIRFAAGKILLAKSQRSAGALAWPGDGATRLYPGLFPVPIGCYEPCAANVADYTCQTEPGAAVVCGRDYNPAQRPWFWSALAAAENDEIVHAGPSRVRATSVPAAW